MTITTDSLPNGINTCLDRLPDLCKVQYGERLVSLVVFGSVGRGTPRPDSDIDLLLVIRDLPAGRIARVREFAAIEAALGAESGSRVELSPVFKSPEELTQGSLLLLDMLDDARILYDQDDFFKNYLRDLSARLQKLGARRIWRGDTWYWDLKPDYVRGEVFEV